MESVTMLFEYINTFMSNNMTLLIVTCIFMLLDIVSGCVKAWATRTFSSTKLRQGLAHKLGFLFVMCVVAILQVALFDPHFTLEFDFPLFSVVCGFIIFMEFVSILENAAVLNPQLDKLIGKYFDNSKDPDNVNIDSLV